MSTLATSTDLTAAAVRDRLTGRRRDIGGRIFEASLLLALLVSLAILLTLLVDVISRGASVYLDRGVDFITAPLSSDPTIAGIGQGLFGSIALMIVVAVIAFPIGIGAAIYLEEYARDTRFTRFITANIRNLAGVPSIVYGLLGLAVFVVALRFITGPEPVRGRSILSGGLTLAILVMPIVVITTTEALRAVPRGIREAAYGVGATRWQVVRGHVLPYAAPGILTGTILAVARAFGETAPLIMVGGAVAFINTRPDRNVVEILQGQYTTLPTTIFNWVRLPQREFVALSAAGIIALLVAILLVNGIAILLRNRYARKW